MVRFLLLLFVALCGGCASVPTESIHSRAGWTDAPVFASEAGGSSAAFSGWSVRDADDDDVEDETGAAGAGWAILMYIPNRVLDAFDMVRARLRLGPGFAVGARATDYADAFIGAYATVYAGLPGARGRKLPRLPVGLESKSGAEVSVVDATVEGGVGPHYGKTEIGVSFQLALIGADVGFDPMEIVDFVVGFAGFDPQDDDY